MRKIITNTLIACGMMVLSACQSFDYSKTEKPNILFFLVDDQRNDVIGCAGHKIVQTPTIDDLARHGIRFQNAYVTTSICAASRASIFTGLYESKHGYTFGTEPVSRQMMEASYPRLLKQAGYRTGFIGKFGIRIEDQEEMLPLLFDFYKPSPQSVPHFVTMADGTQRHSSEIKGDQAVEFLESQPSDQPFCLSISFNAVHAVDGNLTPGNEGHYPYPASAEKLYEGIPMPPPDLNDPAIFDSHPDFLKNSMNRERFYWRWDTEEKYQTNLRAYFRMISGYDQVMSRVIDSLRSKGYDQNTVIIYSADNGYYMGNRGFAGKWTHFEESVRVPLIVFDPRLPRRLTGQPPEDLVLNLDIPATILDLAGVSLPESWQGRSLVPVLAGDHSIEARTEFLIEHRMNNPTIPKYVGLHQERYVYVNYYEQVPNYEYLHDLLKDPQELTNLAKDPAYADLLEEMRRSCAAYEARVRK